MKRTELERLYDRYNRKWFGNRLPKNCRVMFTYHVPEKSLGAMRHDPPLIGLDPETRKWEVVYRASLLHEMVHLDIGDVAHGRTGRDAEHPEVFHKGMRRLARIGALNPLW